jgi:hypothetical protein
MHREESRYMSTQDGGISGSSWEGLAVKLITIKMILQFAGMTHN